MNQKDLDGKYPIGYSANRWIVATNGAKNMAIASKTKNVAVYNKLRQAIIKGKLKPGQKVVMAELAKAFGLSETPVREAIRRLESEGYIDFTPHMAPLLRK